MSSLANSLFQPPVIGDSIDIYILRSELYKGAMATLFLAEDLLSKEQVVLKIPCSDILNQPILLYHYQNEERISRLLDHPGIVHFVHRQRSRQYLIMEHILGKDLRSMVGKNRALKLDTALPLMLNLCHVVAYLHKKGIVHLDLKPENIICLKDSAIKVIDFGLAHCRDLADLLALDLKNPQGTPWYVAPEQLLGERSDPRCDIYSMGMIFYEMLTGQLPWPRSSKIQIARRRLRHDSTPPRYHNPDIPPQIQDIILRAIARHVKERYSCVEDMQADLEEWRKLPITETGRNTKKISLWRSLFSGKASVQRSSPQKKEPRSGTKPQILASLIDSEESEDILAEVKKQAILRSADVTLVHVIEEESDSDLNRYGISVEGESLMVRLEHAVQVLRSLSIDPSIRLIRGEVVEVLERLSTDLSAELLVLGVSRKKKGFLGSVSWQQRLGKSISCALIVADKEKFSPLADMAAYQPNQLTPQQVLACDIFLVDLWYEHLHYHTDFIYQKLLFPQKDVDLSETRCAFGRWLVSLATSKSWMEVISILEPIHIRFHQTAAAMVSLCGHDLAGMKELYNQESLPLSCSLKKELGRVSLLLRAHLDQPPPEVPFLTDTSCPATMPDLLCYGPLLRAFNLDEDLLALIRDKEKSVSRVYSTEGD